MFNLMKAFVLCVCARCVADTMQHGVLFLFGEGINWARYFDVSKPLRGFPKKLEIELAVLNSSKVINPRNVSERRWDFQRDTQEVANGKLIHTLYPVRKYSKNFTSNRCNIQPWKFIFRLYCTSLHS